MRVDYNIKENVLGLVNEPQILEFDDRKKWTKSNEVEINEKVKVISLCGILLSIQMTLYSFPG